MTAFVTSAQLRAAWYLPGPLDLSQAPGVSRERILRHLDGIVRRDDSGQIVEADWPVVAYQLNRELRVTDRLRRRVRDQLARAVSHLATNDPDVTVAYEHGSTCIPDTGCTRTCPGGQHVGWTSGPFGLVEVTQGDLVTEEKPA